MSERPLIRPGGRSERIQKAVHAAVRELLEEVGEEALTVPMIAARAEVTPSTIYRRWNTFAELLTAVLRKEFHGDRDPPNTGSFREDLRIWLEQFVDDISSGPGRTLLQERVGNAAVARQAAGYAFANLRTLTNQATQRGEAVHDPDRLMDLIVAPVIYRLVFASQSISREYQHQLLDTVLGIQPLGAVAHQPSFQSYVIYVDS